MNMTDLKIGTRLTLAFGLVAVLSALGMHLASGSNMLGVVPVLLAAVCAWMVTGSLTTPMARAVALSNAIADGKYDNDVKADGSDEVATLIGSLCALQAKQKARVEADRIAANEMSRIKIALDSVSTGVMIADAERKIVYINTSVQKLLKEAESELRKALPTFNADKLIGESIDQFHKNPAHQAGMLGNLSRSVTAQLSIGTRHMQVIASPVINDKGERLGAVAEWQDRTEELRMEGEKKATADEMARIKIALDSVSTGVMIANAERKIIYVNASVQKLLRDAESDLRKVLPSFNANKLIGESIDQFHKNPAHQAGLLGNLSQSITAQLNIGARHMQVIASPVINDKGERLGAVAEWQDRTQELRMEGEKKTTADEMARIKIALDSVSTGVMIANAERKIIYVNASVQRLLKTAEQDLKKVLPSFSADRLIGESIDQFHKNPAHQAGLLGNLNQPITAQLSIGARRMQVIASPVINDKNERLGAVAEWQDRTEELRMEDEKTRTANEMARIKIALDNVSTGVMIANAEREIIYVNAAVTTLLRGAESEIRKSLPNFNANKLVGVNIDTFHKNPKHQADMLASLNKTYTTPLRIGSRHMVVTANPVINDKGERLGAVAEWQDRTNEVNVEHEVAEIVQGAMMGDFNKRLALEGKEGFFKTLAEGLNSLSDTTSTGLNDVARVLQTIAQGDLTQKIDGEYSGIFGQLKDDTNATVERLREVIGRIKDASEAINVAAKEISAGNVDLSSRTEEQASSLEETASSMEELNSTVKQNAENANQANTLAKSSNDIAVKSGQMVQQIVTTMTGISESSKKIADIIGVIDSIAFQTNILALNAAVEAARAGEQGRGFAVVATEVRNLAQRSATAAKEIKDLISESGGKVDAGTKLVDQAGQSMTDVVTSFSQVTALVTDIANASKEQASGIEQVSQAVGQMDEVTQQNAALVEESAAAAESLEEQAHGLVQAVAMFKLAEGAGNERSRNLPGPALRTTTMKKIAKAPPSRPAAGATPGGAKRLPPAHLAGEADEEWSEF